MFTDSHCHLYKEYYSNIDNILVSAYNGGINRIINCGCDYNSNLEVLETINKYANVYGALGIHPNEIKDVEKTIKQIEENIQNKKIIAIGEIGLDYHYEGFDKEKQIMIFKKILNLAVKYNKPVIIHSRDASEDTYEILKKAKVTGIIHSFSGDLELANKYINLGYLLGINGTITFKNSKLIEVIKNIPINKILVETDSPYLSPIPFRGQKNEPKRLLETVKFLSENLNLNLNILADILEKNLQTIFDI